MAVNLPCGLGNMPVGTIGDGPGRNTGAPIWRATGPGTPQPSDVAQWCAAAIASDFYINVNLAGSRLSWCDKQANGDLLFNWDLYESRVRRYTVAGGATQAVADAVTAAFTSRKFIAYTVDEPYIAPFAGTIPNSVANDMGLLYKSIWPGCLTAQRSAFEFMTPAPSGGWTGLDYGWAQWNRTGILTGKTIREWFDYQRAGFLALNMGMIPGMNWLLCGDSRTWDILNNGSSSGTVPGEGGNGRLLCSPANIQDVADAIYDDADAPLFSGYVYTSTTLGKDYQAYEVRSDFVAAFDYMLNKFATRPTFNGYRTAKGAPVNPGGGGSAGISHIGTVAAAATSLTPTAHLALDLLVAVASRVDTGTTITVPAGWTAINGGNSPNATVRYAYRIASAPGTLSGTWTNATALSISVYRGAHPTTPIGGQAMATGTANVSYNTPALTLTDGLGTSWIHTAVVQTLATNVNSPPTGLTSRGTAGQLGTFDTNAAVAAWALVAKTLNASGAYRSLAIELRADPAAVGGTTNNAPLLNSLESPHLVTEDALLTFVASATDPDGDTLAFSLVAGTSAVPAGASITADGVFTWTPAQGTAGTYNIKVKVTDTTGINPAGLFDDQAIDIIVAPAPTEPIPPVVVVSAFSGGLSSLT